MKIGWLYLPSPEDRWHLIYAVKPELDYDVLTSGTVIEVLIQGHWVQTRIEHNGKGYYAVQSGVKLANELKARIPR